MYTDESVTGQLHITSQYVLDTINTCVTC